MTYYTGTVNTLTELRSALVSACTANGWSWNSSTDVLSKTGRFIGKDLFAKLQISGNFLTLLGQTTASSGAAPYVVKLGGTYTGVQAPKSLVFPLIYHIHIFDYEVYLRVNFNIDYWQHLGFGQSAIPLPGTGMWVDGWAPSDTTGGPASSDCLISGTNTFYSAGNGSAAGRFTFAVQSNTRGAQQSTFIHSDLDGQGWFQSYTSGVNNKGLEGMAPLPALLPNDWNKESSLLVIKAHFMHQNNYMAPVVELEHCRGARNDYYQPGQVVNVGTERWKIYPIIKKDATVRNGYDGSPHSGTIAQAIRYDGP